MICTESWFPKGHWPLIFTSTSCFIQSKWIQWYKGRVMFPASPAAPLQNPTACNWLGAGRELPGNTWMLPECESQAEPQPPDSLGRAWAHQHHPHSPFSYRKPPHHHHNSGLQGVGRRPSELSQASSRSHLLLWGLWSVQKPSICSAHYSLQSFLYTVVAFSLFGKQFSKYIKSETCTWLAQNHHSSII